MGFRTTEHQTPSCLTAMPNIPTEDIEKLMKRCQIGVGGRDALDEAHSILAKCYGTLCALVQQRDELLDQNEKLGAEMLTPEMFIRLVEWLREDPIRRASNAFTAGIERQIAYAIEDSVVPLIKSLRIQLQNAAHPVAETRQVVGVPLPCPFCGNTEVSVSEGSTFRWRIAVCDNCGAQASEVRHDTLAEDQKAAEDQSTADAISAWNIRCSDPKRKPAPIF